MRCASRASNGPNHLGLCALQTNEDGSHKDRLLKDEHYQPQTAADRDSDWDALTKFEVRF